MRIIHAQATVDERKPRLIGIHAGNELGPFHRAVHKGRYQAEAAMHPAEKMYRTSNQFDQKRLFFFSRTENKRGLLVDPQCTLIFQNECRAAVRAHLDYISGMKAVFQANRLPLFTRFPSHLNLTLYGYDAGNPFLLYFCLADRLLGKD